MQSCKRCNIHKAIYRAESKAIVEIRKNLDDEILSDEGDPTKGWFNQRNDYSNLGIITGDEIRVIMT